MLVLANLVVALLAPGDTCGALATYARYGLVPATVIGPDEISLGACGTTTSLGVEAIVTHLFVHAGWLHVGANMLYLWVFGDNVEDRRRPPACR